MRALENYNRQRDKKLGNMVGTCMKSLWVCYATINVSWLLLVAVHGDYRKGMFYQCVVPIVLAGLIWWVYKMNVIKKERELHHIVTYLILNIYVVLLLSHPSGLLILDGLVFGVIVT